MNRQRDWDVVIEYAEAHYRIAQAKARQIRDLIDTAKQQQRLNYSSPQETARSKQAEFQQPLSVDDL